MKIGDKVYVASDFNRKGGEMTITGETARSWIVGESWESYKVPKRASSDREERGNYRMVKVSNCGITHRAFYLTRASYDNVCWAGKHKRGILSMVERLGDSPDEINTLRRIAEAVGYRDKG